MPIKPISDITALIGRRSDLRGLQFAHIIGEAFYRKAALAWIYPLLPNADDETNFTVLPESERGSAILGVASHIGSQSGAFDRFFFENLEDSSKFLDELKRKLVEPNSDISALRTELLNFLDYVKILFLYDEIQLAGDLTDRNDFQSFALNSADPRFINRFDVTDYYEGSGTYTIRQDLLDYDVIVGSVDELGNAIIPPNPIYIAIANAREAGETIDDEWLVSHFPDLSRVLYPNGEIAWATREGDAYQAIQADILAREAVLSGLIALDGGVERIGVYPEYFALIVDANTGEPTIEFARIVDEFARVIDAISQNQRAVSITGNALFDGLVMDNERLFTGVFDNVFSDLNDTKIDAYRLAPQLSQALADMLAERANYLAQFVIDDQGSATFQNESRDIANRLATGAAAKAYAVTKTIVAGGRYGFGSIDYKAWRDAQFADGRSLAYDLADGGFVTVAITQSAGYVRFDGVADFRISDVVTGSSAIANAAQPGSLVQLVAAGVKIAAEEFERITKRLDQGLALVGGNTLGAKAREYVESVRLGKLPGPIEFVFRDGAAVAQQDGETLVGFDNAELMGNQTDNILIKFGAGNVRGGGGSDVLVSLRAPVLEGDAASGGGLSSGSSGGGGASGSWGDSWEFGDTGYGGWGGGGGSFGGGGATGSWDPPTNDRNAPSAPPPDVAVLDGGSGNDWVIAFGGKGTETIGGLGRDWIYNTSSKGEICGDIQNSQIDQNRNRYYVTTEVGSDGNPKTVKHFIADDKTNSDNFWWSSTTTIKDAGKYDVLKFFGIPLVGGDSGGGVTLNALTFGLAGLGASVAQGLKAPANQIFIDFFLPFITYSFERKNGHLDMLVGNVFERIFSGFGQTAENTAKGVMRVENVDAWFSYTGSAQSSLAHKGSLGMAFKVVNPIWEILAHLPETLLTFGASGGGPLVEFAMTASAAASRFYEAAKWKQSGDPLILDLDGDGIETVAIDASEVYFDLNQNLFRERTGWVSGDDGLLALDRNGNGAIDNGAELFGADTGSGIADLAVFDLNHDGKIDATDAVFADLRVWQDVNQDGVSQAGELHGLVDLGIVSISLTATVLDGETNDGTLLRSAAGFIRADGSAGTLYEAIFQSNHTDTKYAGETGAPAWATSTLNAKGFGSITDLAVAMANDADLGQLAATAAAAMTAPNLQTLVQQAGSVLGAWGSSLELTRELYAVRLSGDGKTLLERQVWGGAALAAGWSLEQGWSPATRGPAAVLRDEAPYLTRIVNGPSTGSGSAGRAVILDYGILQADGSWKLASDPSVTYATKAAITALGHPAGTEWRVEEIGFNPYADLPVDTIGVRFTDGQVVDYTVQVTDGDGTFFVWARNLDRALQLEWKTGDAREFQLRNYAITFAELDEVNSSDDSTFRVELLTPAQFHFATSLGGIDFRPEMRISRRAAAANDNNSAWPERPFYFADERVVA